MGDHYRQARSFLESLFYYKQLLEAKQLSPETKANALYSIAKIYAELYQVDLASRYLKQTLEPSFFTKA